VGLTAVFLIGGVWYLSRTITLADIQQALLLADGRYILLALAAFTLNGTLKAWRWRVLLSPNNEKRLSFTAVFWAIWLGQFVNTMLPFLRLGEIGRVYALNQQTGFGKTQAISTVLIEKSMEIVFLGLILLLLIPLAVLPQAAQQLGVAFTVTASFLLLTMGFVTYQTEKVIKLLQRFLTLLPTSIEQWFSGKLISGLKGLSALRHTHSLRSIFLASLLITLLDITVPYVLFIAFSLPLGIVAAILVNVAIAIVTTPPTTPGELGIFEAAVLFTLQQVGQSDTAVIFSYALVFHLCTLLPKIILGSIATIRTKWSWRFMQSQSK